MKQFDDHDEIEIDLGQIIKVVLSKMHIIIAVGVVAAILTLFVCNVIVKPQYESTTKLYIINRQNEGTTTYSDIQSSTQLVKDYKVLVTSEPVLGKVISSLNLETTIEELEKQITVSIETDSRVLEIKVLDRDPYTAKYIADALADISSEQITDVMKIEGVNVIEYGRVATEQTSPDTKKNVIIGALIGAVLITVVILAKFILDDSIKSSDDIEKYLGISTLSLIPISESERPNMKKRKIV